MVDHETDAGLENIDDVHQVLVAGGQAIGQRQNPGPWDVDKTPGVGEKVKLAWFFFLGLLPLRSRV